MLEKFKTLYWFLIRPSHWLHLMALISRKFRKDFDSPSLRSKSREWASKRVVELKEALLELELLSPEENIDLKLDTSLIKQGNSLAKESKVKMGGEGHLDLIYSVTALSKSKKVLETGVAYGWSSLAFLAALERIEDSELCSVDMPYPKMNNESFVGIVVPKKMRSNWNLIREPDRNGIKKAISKLGGEIDICHYDSDKSYQGRRYAYPLLWEALRKGGIFISDDIQDNFAFKEFVEEKNLSFSITKHQGKYIGIMKKKS